MTGTAISTEDAITINLAMGGRLEVRVAADLGDYESDAAFDYVAYDADGEVSEEGWEEDDFDLEATMTRIVTRGW